ncbi:MAG: membrane protein insertase YidC [Bacteroidota bacterium]|nr:membrane protein insertase YidC [Bacteroidota bacterium]
MDRNQITGFILIAAIVFGVTYFFNQNKETTDTKSKEPITAQAPTIKDKTVKNVLPDTIAKDTNSLVKNMPVYVGKNENITIQNDLIKMKVSTLGAQPSYVELKKFKAFDKVSPLVLVDSNSSDLNYVLTIDNQPVNSNEINYKVSSSSANKLVLEADFANGRKLVQSYSLENGSYQVKSKLEFVNMNELIAKNALNIDIEWKALTRRVENDTVTSRNNTSVHYRHHDESPSYLSETSDDDEKFNKPTDWVSFKQQFFAQTIIADPENPFERSDVKVTTVNQAGYEKEMETSLSFPYNHKPTESYTYKLYYGPIDYKALKKLDLGLEKQVPLGWSFFLTSWVNRFIILPVFDLLKGTALNFGIIILLLTIFIKIIILPFTYKSQISMAKMRILKPDLDALKEKHGGDMAKMQPEQMKLYKRAGVSPLGGCLPLLLQFPILIAMFRFFPSSIELRQQSFLWATDLSTYDSIATLPFNIPFYGNHVSLFTLLMTVSTIIYTRMNNSLSSQPKEMQWISYLMPIMFLGFFNQYAAGLSLYYLYFNLLTFVQQYLFKIFINDDKLKAKIEENKRRPESELKKNGFQARLLAIQKQQEIAKSQKTSRGSNNQKSTKRK